MFRGLSQLTLRWLGGPKQTNMGFRGLLELLFGLRGGKTVPVASLAWWDDAGQPVDGLTAIGAVAGVAVSYASPDNATDSGYQWAGWLQSTGTHLKWKAPGSETYGAAVSVAAGGTFTLRDGTRPNAYVTVEVYPAFLSPETQRVLLQDLYTTAVAPSDVTAEQAAAGHVLEYRLRLVNTGYLPLTAATVWLDPQTTLIEISDDGSTWVAPTTEATGLVLGGMEPDQQTIVHVRRTVASGATPEPFLLTALHASAQLVSREFTAAARGAWRIWGTPEYRLYRSAVAPPAEDDTPWDTAASLPVTPSDTFADGTWYLAVSYFNGVLDSGFLPQAPAGLPYRRITITDGVILPDPPTVPGDWRLAQRDGLPWIEALYWEDDPDQAATEWAIDYTTDGSDPTASDPSLVIAIDGSQLVYALPAVASGTTIKAVLQVRRNDGSEEAPAWNYSAAGDILSLVIDTTGPAAPIAAATWRGKLPAFSEE
jgi:hypothetical protein